jgi:hypothetical protein
MFYTKLDSDISFGVYIMTLSLEKSTNPCTDEEYFVSLSPCTKNNTKYGHKSIQLGF